MRQQRLIGGAPTGLHRRQKLAPFGTVFRAQVFGIFARQGRSGVNRGQGAGALIVFMRRQNHIKGLLRAAGAVEDPHVFFSDAGNVCRQGLILQAAGR